MRATEWNFGEQTSAETREELQRRIEHASSLDEILDFWFLEKGNRLGLSVSISEEDDTVNQDTIALFLDDSDGTSVCSVDLFRTDLMDMYPEVAPFDSFVKGWNKNRPCLELHERKFKLWMKSLGFSDSYALMSRIGPRSAALPVMLSFALSGKGVVEAHHVKLEHYPDEDYKADLKEEDIDLTDYFNLHAAYMKNPASRSGMMTMFDPFYCRKV
ncbi:MAG: hypothetical protein RL518_920 [Pseudomonadota bacterium]